MIQNISLALPSNPSTPWPFLPTVFNVTTQMLTTNISLVAAGAQCTCLIPMQFTLNGEAEITSLISTSDRFTPRLETDQFSTSCCFFHDCHRWRRMRQPRPILSYWFIDLFPGLLKARLILPICQGCLRLVPGTEWPWPGEMVETLGHVALSNLQTSI